MDASEYQAIIRISATLLIGILALVIVLMAVRWRQGAIKQADELPDTERMALEMEALAAQKRAQRKTEPVETDNGPETAVKTDPPQDGFIEGEPLA